MDTAETWNMDSLFRANNFCGYALLMKASYVHVLPPLEAKGS